MVVLNFYNREKRPWPNRRLKQASIIGHTTATSVRLWFRVGTPGDYGLVISQAPIPTDGVPVCLSPVSFKLLTANQQKEVAVEQVLPLNFVYDHDLTQVADLQNLSPDTRYYYALFKQQDQENTWELGYEEILSFQTFPEQPQDLTFGFYSCHLPYKGSNLGSMQMWESFYKELSEANAKFVIAGGDQVYVDGHKDLNIWKWLQKVKHHHPSLPDMVSWYRDIYRGYWGIENVQKLFNHFPTYMMWDDHDLKDGWGSFTEAELAAQLNLSWRLQNSQENLRLAYQMFEAGKQVYQEYQHSHNPPTESNQFDYHFDYGPYGFYVLDLRGQRDFNRKKLQILGEEQWSRFATWMDQKFKSDVQALLIVSSVPVVHGDSFLVNILDIPYLKYTDDFRDHWEHQSHWEERNQMLRPLFQWSNHTQKPVIFLSGDVHVATVFKMSHPEFPQARVFQLTSSPLSTAIGKLEKQFLKIFVKDYGQLGDFRENVPYQFRNIYVSSNQNFGILHLREEEGKLSMIFDLFSSTGKKDGIIEKKRVNLHQLS